MSVANPALTRLAFAVGSDRRVRAAVEEHYDGLWRFLRRMGVEPGAVEDAVQHVLLVFAQRSGDVDPGLERSFLFGTALRVASDVRRRRGRELAQTGHAVVAELAHPAPDAEHQLQRRELRHLLDQVLDGLSPELRAVFILAELEELTMAEIARTLGLPPGTVASRLRRARELFATKAHELRAFVDKGSEP